MVAKKTKNKYIIAGIMGVIMALSPFSFGKYLQAEAQDSSAAGAKKKPTVDCSILEDPTAQTDKIITVLEESIGNDSQVFDESTAQVINCMRITTCKKENVPDANTTDGEKNGVCESKYAEIAATCPSDSICQRVQVFIAQSGMDLLFGYLGTIYRWLAGIIGVVCVLYIIWGGVMIAVSGDNSQAIDDAKQKIIQSIAGLVVLFLSAIILATINPNFFKL